MCPAPLASPDENAQIATQLREAAALLQAQGGNPFRVGAYRKAAAASLRTIAPKRFNPSGEAWLPVLHAQRGEWHFTALYSNTARAHELGRTRDWVVIYYYDGDHVEGQCTVVTESRGALAGKRVVRGREEECRAH